MSTEAGQDQSYVPKVKNLLTGLPVTSDEVAQVAGDPDALRTLVAGWMATPEYQSRMIELFTTAFQQDGVTANFIQAQLFCFAFFNYDERVVANARESFGRTAMELVNEGQPFTSTMTTTRFMLTPPLMMLMAYQDEHVCYDNGYAGENAYNNDPNFHLLMTPQTIALTDSANPASPNFMSFTSPQLQAATGNCAQPNGVYFGPSSGGIFGGSAAPSIVLGILWGGGFSGNGCSYGSSTAGPTNSNDFSTWHMVNVRAPASGEKTTRFYDIAKMRSTSELVFYTPRVGFYTTLAFLANWNTNTSNQFRVTMNQTLITGLGHAFDGTDSIMPQSLAALDTNHAAPGTACYGCHITLDPMRQYFKQQYNYETTPFGETSSIPGQFAFDGVSVVGQGIADLGVQMAAHPTFAAAWTQKLCTWANSGPCNPNDPEFVRIQQVFMSSNFNWNSLVLEMLTSPIITQNAQTLTNAGGGNFPVAKKQILCDLLSLRLGITDICSLNPSTVTPASLASLKTISTIMPFDSYARGSTMPTQANSPGLFFRASLDNLCIATSKVAIDGTSGAFPSSDPNGAIANMAHTLMALTPPRDATPIAILTGHYNASVTAGLTPVEALQSTFTLACLSPTVAGVGQ